MHYLAITKGLATNSHVMQVLRNSLVLTDSQGIADMNRIAD